METRVIINYKNVRVLIVIYGWNIVCALEFKLLNVRNDCTYVSVQRTRQVCYEAERTSSCMHPTV